MNKKIMLLMMVSICAVISGCGAKNVNYKDGTYVGRSSIYTSEDGTDDGNGYGEVSITLKDNKVVECEFITYEPDDKLKDEEYGKANGEIANRDFYNKAQKAIAACDEYEKLIVENGGLEGVDAISGATINYNSLEEAMIEALKQAEVEG